MTATDADRDDDALRAQRARSRAVTLGTVVVLLVLSCFAGASVVATANAAR